MLFLHFGYDMLGVCIWFKKHLHNMYIVHTHNTHALGKLYSYGCWQSVWHSSSYSIPCMGFLCCCWYCWRPCPLLLNSGVKLCLCAIDVPKWYSVAARNNAKICYTLLVLLVILINDLYCWWLWELKLHTSPCHALSPRQQRWNSSVSLYVYVYVSFFNLLFW